MSKWIAFVLLSSLVACAATPDADRSSNAKKKATGKSGQFGPDDGANDPENNIAGTGTGEVWGQSADTLYRLDPTTKAVTTIGQFSGCGEVMDIALDANSQLYATTQDGLFTVDKSTARCTRIAGGQYPNSLSFVPAGTIDATSETLVGYLGSQYIKIDPKTGVTATLGDLGNGLSSSGDIVSVKNGKTFLTVTGTGCEASDCLIEVDPKTGTMLKNWGPIGQSEVYGLAFWAGSVYAFDSRGGCFEISFEGNQLKTVSIAFPSAGGTLQFWGAGSTTSAPVVAVK